MENNKKLQILKVFIFVGIVTAVVVCFQTFFYSPMRVNGDSMNPAFSDKDILLVNRFQYRKEEPKRYDLVVFNYKYDQKTRYIKRVIGLPGETVEIKNNTIYIDSEELKEYYGLYDGDERHLEDYPAYTLAEDEYFVLGDNRDHSVDSRSGDVGPVEKDMIIGRAAFRLLPFDAIGSLKYQ